MSDNEALQERCATALGWSLKDVQAFSLQTLRELLRREHPKLAAALAEVVQSRSYELMPPTKGGRRS